MARDSAQPGASTRPRVVIVGGGFAGLACARELKKSPCDVTLIDRKNHHVFQPLLYQVATAALSPANIAAPIRRIVRKHKNCRVVLGEVSRIDLDAKAVHADGRAFPYDHLVLACGVTHSYFGHQGWADLAPGLKTIEDALEIRRRILLAFEAAELEDDPDRRHAELTFVIVGAGPTGVELAGAIAEIAAKSIPRDFRRVDTRTARVILVEGGPKLLPSYPDELGDRAARDLRQLGVDVRTDAMVTHIDAAGVTIGDDERIDARSIIWAAGVRASGLSAQLAKDFGVGLDKVGRIKVGVDLSVPDHPEVFVAGDLMSRPRADSSDEPVPGVAPAAMQAGEHVGRVIARAVRSGDEAERLAFRYRDKGSMATIGRARAVAVVGGRRFAGLPAWVLWSVVHTAFLIGFRNKVLALLEWAWLYLFWSRGARLITDEGDDGPSE